ncbi:hypothetical protein EVAR_48116_1 [Eumeta japonica]|uniref:Uncharacterized protein n=1 Tax=Eumeta variegata TaxID=151549 RepID=A0A4C2AAP7_EUMVA|nr:hypothetical protein EVAR_48116_1 [Eumeta japonica]
MPHDYDLLVPASVSARSLAKMGHTLRMWYVLDLIRVCAKIGVIGTRKGPYTPLPPGEKKRSNLTSVSLGVSLLPLVQARRLDRLFGVRKWKAIIIRCRLPFEAAFLANLVSTLVARGTRVLRTQNRRTAKSCRRIRAGMRSSIPFRPPFCQGPTLPLIRHPSVAECADRRWRVGPLLMDVSPQRSRTRIRGVRRVRQFASPQVSRAPVGIDVSQFFRALPHIIWLSAEWRPFGRLAIILMLYYAETRRAFCARQLSSRRCPGARSVPDDWLYHGDLYRLTISVFNLQVALASLAMPLYMSAAFLRLATWGVKVSLLSIVKPRSRSHLPGQFLYAYVYDRDVEL